MEDVTLRGVIERSFFSSVSYAQISFATFAAYEFVLEGLDEFLELAGDPWAPPVSEGDLRLALAFLHEAPVRAQLPRLLAELPFAPPLGGWDLPQPRMERLDLVDRLLAHTLSSQRFAPTSVVEEVTRRRLADMLEYDRILGRELRQTGARADAVATAIRLFVVESWRYDEAGQTLTALYRQEIPFALSPEIQSESLRAVVREARKFAVLPLMGGAFGATTAVSSGHYVTALEMAAAGGGATIIIAGAAVVTDRLLGLLARR